MVKLNIEHGSIFIFSSFKLLMLDYRPGPFALIVRFECQTKRSYCRKSSDN